MNAVNGWILGGGMLALVGLIVFIWKKCQAVVAVCTGLLIEQYIPSVSHDSDPSIAKRFCDVHIISRVGPSRISECIYVINKVFQVRFHRQTLRSARSCCIPMSEKKKLLPPDTNHIPWLSKVATTPEIG
jgi:hypothetical protein